MRAVGRRIACFVGLVVFCLMGVRPAAAIEIQRVVSPGGIEAWLVEQRTIPLIAVNFGFKGGARLDPEGKMGLANFASGVIDEGAGDLDSRAFQQRLEELAIRLRFDADRDAFHGSLQTLSENRDEAFRLVRLALTAPRFDDEPVSRIRAQIMAVLANDRENPERIASNNWFANAFPEHVYGRPVNGEPANIESISADDLRAFTVRQFARNRLFIGVVGDIGANELAALLDSTFGALPASSNGIVENRIAPATGYAEIIQRDIPQTVMMFGLPGLLRSDPDFIPAYVMNYVLGGGGFNSRLTEEIREKRGLAYSVYSYLAPLEEAGLFIGGVATQNARAGETLALVREELARMREEGLSQQELDNAKTYLIGSFPLRFDSNSKIAQQLLGLQLQGLGIDYFDKRNDLIAAVTLEDVNRVARRLLHPENLLVVGVGQPEGIEVAN